MLHYEDVDAASMSTRGKEEKEEKGCQTVVWHAMMMTSEHLRLFLGDTWNVVSLHFFLSDDDALHWLGGDRQRRGRRAWARRGLGWRSRGRQRRIGEFVCIQQEGRDWIEWMMRYEEKIDGRKDER